MRASTASRTLAGTAPPPPPLRSTSLTKNGLPPVALCSSSRPRWKSARAAVLPERLGSSPTGSQGAGAFTSNEPMSTVCPAPDRRTTVFSLRSPSLPKSVVSCSISVVAGATICWRWP